MNLGSSIAMTTYYQTRRDADRIWPVLVTGETGKTVLVSGRWQRKRGPIRQYHPTYEHARFHLAKRTKAEIRELESRLAEKRKLLAELEGGR